MHPNVVLSVAPVALLLFVGCSKGQRNVQSAADWPGCARVEMERDRFRAERDRALAQSSELRSLAQRRQEIYEQLQQDLAELIESDKVDLVFRRGLIVLQLPDSILFPSGKAELRDEGLALVRQVAAAISDIKDRQFLITGHTDSELILASRWASNWHLSTARAQVVLDVILRQGNNPEQLAVAGFGEYDPVADNTTEQGRALNRRTEIRIIPNLERIFETVTIDDL